MVSASTYSVVLLTIGFEVVDVVVVVEVVGDFVLIVVRAK